MRLISVLVFFSLIISCKPEKSSLVEQYDLSSNWIFRDKSEAEWYPANIPGTIHTDLQDNRIIPDPFYGCNEQNLQWIGERSWIYKTQFYVDSATLSKKNIRLVFEGLDTYADVLLNGEKILQANNMHRRWEVSCTSKLVFGNNTLEVELASAIEQIKRDSAALGYPLPGGQWAFVRKAAYHFGWDWGPRFVTAGIYKPVYLEAWDSHRPTDFYINTKAIANSSASLELNAQVESSVTEKAIIKITDSNTGKQLHKEQVSLLSGINNISTKFSIKNPKLWWTNGLGEPHIYDLQVELITESGNSYTQTIPLGIRTIRTILKDDEHGKALYIELNGTPIYMKGGNYIPQHSFVTEVTKTDYQRVVQTAKESNMNMLRVWGGGVYENDIFYELCNRSGILVWQDFMFACSMYPTDSMFAENVKQEAIYQVKRLRKHSNIALWCGNNEVDEAWHNWGWQKSHKLSKADSTTIWDGYKNIFHNILQEVVKEFDPQRFYLSTSPLYGWGREKSMTHGSAHYWGVWWGIQPIEMYLHKVPRFMGEFGLQAMPTLVTIRQFRDENDEYLFSPSLKCHQKHPTGYETIDAYLEKEGLYAETVEEFIYLSQLVQAKGIGLAIEAQRRAKPYCMGSLYWQLNDCWPVTSWSSTDYFGNWKTLQYRVRELYDDILVSVIEYKEVFEVFVVSDRLTDTKGNITINTIDSLGKRENIFSKSMHIEANSSLQIISESADGFFKNIDKSSTLIEAIYTDAKGKEYANRKFLVPLGKIKLPKTSIKHSVKLVDGGYNITLTSDTLAAYVQLYLTNSNANFSNNFIHIYPNKEVVIFCKTDITINQLEEQLRVVCLNNGSINND
ncbi:MAG: glycoside hydrolase family 2 protein [Bacteroidales bacterium]|nr:glycoside hydrolase family 2 protein [Bacteroidales bacterium]